VGVTSKKSTVVVDNDDDVDDDETKMAKKHPAKQCKLYHRCNKRLQRLYITKIFNKRVCHFNNRHVKCVVE